MRGAGAGPRRIAEAMAAFHDRRLADPSLSVEQFLAGNPDVAEDVRLELEAMSEIDAAVCGTVPEDLPASLSGYTIASELGAGGMGRVFLAADDRLGRRVAIKTLSPRYAGDPVLRARFMHEARAMARITHPNVARIYALGPGGEPPHFVMEYVEGVPLTRAAAPLTLEQKAELMRKVALAVQCLHEHGILHRDLKPGNILVGPDLEPKLLDFGLALEQADASTRLTSPGEFAGTPEYFSPEHGDPGVSQDARSDVFSLGAVLYEMLAGALPFSGATVAEQVRLIREQDPAPPRRINPEVPGELQNICMKALEKNPADRYASARDMATDLARYLAGEPVLASPPAFSRMMAGKAGQHLREIEAWRRDRLLTEYEYDAFRKDYERLVEREDAWIMEARRLSLPQVTLYFGAWLAAVGAALIVLFRYASLAGLPAILITSSATALLAWTGMGRWRAGLKRVGVAFLLAACLLLPITLLVFFGDTGLLSAATRGREDLELFSKLGSFRRVTNAQMWWALLLSLPAVLLLRRATRSDVFSVVLAGLSALFCGATLLRLGLMEWIESDPGRPYLCLIPCALLFLGVAVVLERAHKAGDSKYFYPLSVAVMYAALSGVAAFHEPYAKWLGTAAPWTRGQVEYLFLVNALAYLSLQYICDRFDLPQMRAAGKAYRFVVPGHVLVPLLVLGIQATNRWQESPANAGARVEARIFEVLLPVAACAFVFGSIPKQMKNFFATGLLFLAIGVVRLQQNLLKDRAAWPVALLACGIAVMLISTRYTPLRLALRQALRRHFGPQMHTGGHG